jgi:hypothetical protein
MDVEEIALLYYLCLRRKNIKQKKNKKEKYGYIFLYQLEAKVVFLSDFMKIY